MESSRENPFLVQEHHPWITSLSLLEGTFVFTLWVTHALLTQWSLIAAHLFFLGLSDGCVIRQVGMDLLEILGTW